MVNYLVKESSFAVSNVQVAAGLRRETSDDLPGDGTLELYKLALVCDLLLLLGILYM
jgi:hypothetical protein